MSEITKEERATLRHRAKTYCMPYLADVLDALEAKEAECEQLRRTMAEHENAVQQAWPAGVAMPCGHAQRFVESSDEGTHYCRECERIEGLGFECERLRKALHRQIVNTTDANACATAERILRRECEQTILEMETAMEVPV